MSQTPHQLALDKAKIRMMSSPNSAFITTLCFNMNHVWDNSVPTAAVDGITIFFNTDFWMSLDADEQFFLLQHETWHPAFMHMHRRGDRDPKRYNIAGDHVINLMLIEAKSGKMPKDGYADAQYSGMSTEQVYDLLPVDDEKSKGFHPDVKAPPGAGDSGGSGASGSDAERELEDLLIRAAIQSRASNDDPGTIPGTIQIFLDNLLNPKLPWHRILDKYLKARIKNDYSYKKFNRRFFPKYYLPTLDGESLMDIAVAVDTSGSVSDGEFSQFIGEIAGIFKRMKPGKITLLHFDTSIKSIDVVKSVAELMKVKFTGRGGTAIEPVLGWVKENKPDVLLVFTDGEFRFNQPAKPKKTDVIWLIHGRHPFQAPFGKTITYKI